MTDTSAIRGILDTSAVIALRNITDPSALPIEPLITAVTLAELSAGPWWHVMSGNARPGKLTCKKQRQTSTRCPSTVHPHALSAR